MKKVLHDLNDNTIRKQRGMCRFSALVQGIVKTASNHNGRQLWVWVSVWVGIRPLMDIRHKGAVSTRQGDPQFTTASRSYFRWLLQAAVCFMPHESDAVTVCFMPHESDAVTVSGRFAWWLLATVAMAYWYYENELQMVKMCLQYNNVASTADTLTDLTTNKGKVAESYINWELLNADWSTMFTSVVAASKRHTHIWAAREHTE